MKITLNATIPEGLRPQVEAVVKGYVRTAEITWQPSRFPRIVMLVEPGPDEGLEPQEGSFFDPPEPGLDSDSSVSEVLEARIKACLPR